MTSNSSGKQYHKELMTSNSSGKQYHKDKQDDLETALSGDVTPYLAPSEYCTRSLFTACVNVCKKAKKNYVSIQSLSLWVIVISMEPILIAFLLHKLSSFMNTMLESR